MNRQHSHISISTTSGFTLVELIIVMVISSIVGLIGSQLISQPVTAYANLSLRTQLVDSAESSMKRMIYEFQSALPNSIRIGCAGKCVEFLRTIDGSRYRRVNDSAGGGNILSFDQVTPDSDGFDVLGGLHDITSIVTSNNADHCRTGAASCLVIYNTGQTNQNAYNLDNIATISNVSGTPPVIEFNLPVGTDAFPAPSPRQRFQIVDSPISYLCDLSAETITRYQGYPITQNHSDVDDHSELIAFAGTQQAVVTNRVNGCNFSYSSGSETRSALLTVRLTLSETMPVGQTETISLLQQAHISNVP